MQLSDSDQIATTGYDQRHNDVPNSNRQKKQVTKCYDKDIIKDDDQKNNQKHLNKSSQQLEIQDEKQLNYHHSNSQNDGIVVINDKNIMTTTTHNNNIEFEQQQLKNDENNQLQNNEEQNVKQLEEKLSTLVTVQSKQYGKKDNIVHNQNGQQQQQQKQVKKDNRDIKPLQQPKTYIKQPQIITRFNPYFKSPTISLNQNNDQAQQSKYYFDNCKLSLTQPITSIDSTITFRIDNLKYCVGMGVGLKEIIEKHGYDYKSTTTNQLGHGLYIVTTQGYSWSHSQTEEDDVFRGQQWKNLYTGANILVKLQGEILTFKFKKSSFTMTLPSRIREKYTLSFCAYLHEKTDAVSIIS